MVPVLKYALMAAAAALGVWMLYDAYYGPPAEVIASGEVTVTSARSNKTVTVATRQLRRGSRTFWEVSGREGAWIDRAGDCAETYRREVLDFWETREEESGGKGK